MKNITDTGPRGYLKWLQHDQPGIYQRIAARVVQHVPDAFSDREQSRAMGALMDVTTGGWGAGPDWTGGSASSYRWNNPADVARGLSGSTSGGWGNYFGRLGQDITADQAASDNPQPGDSTDVAAAANTGTASPSFASIVSSLVNGVLQYNVGKNQADTMSQINQIQLQRAQAGLPPLQLSMSAAGQPTLVPQSAGPGGLATVGIVVGILAVLGMAVAGGHRASS